MNDKVNVSPREMRKVIMDHYKNPLHKYIPENLSEYKKSHIHATRCNDDFDVYIKLNNGIVEDASFYGEGCTISTAAIDVMCEQIINKPNEEALNIVEEYLKMFENKEFNKDIIDDAVVFYNVNRQPGRIECATIGWIAAKEIIEKE